MSHYCVYTNSPAASVWLLALVLFSFIVLFSEAKYLKLCSSKGCGLSATWATTFSLWHGQLLSISTLMYALLSCFGILCATSFSFWIGRKKRLLISPILIGEKKPYQFYIDESLRCFCYLCYQLQNAIKTTILGCDWVFLLVFFFGKRDTQTLTFTVLSYFLWLLYQIPRLFMICTLILYTFYSQKSIHFISLTMLNSLCYTHCNNKQGLFLKDAKLN